MQEGVHCEIVVDKCLSMASVEINDAASLWWLVIYRLASVSVSLSCHIELSTEQLHT